MVGNDRRIRPTTDSTKELIFNIIRQDIQNSLVLDVFAGTGNLGIEALSRGAAKAVFIESSRKAQQIIHQNLQKTNLLDRARLIRASMEQGLKQLADDDSAFDLIFADPPYEGGLAEETIFRVERLDLLHPNGTMVVEHSSRQQIIEPVKYLLVSRRKQGDTAISFYHYEAK